MGDGNARDMRRLGDDVVDRALVLRVLGPARPVDDEIARRLRMELRVGLHGGVEIDHRRQFLVFHLHQLGGVQRLGGGFRHHHGDRIADVHRRLGERRAERDHHLGAAAADDGRVARDAANAGRLDVLAREHRQHALGGARGVRLHRDDAGVRVRRAHEGGIGLVRQPRSSTKWPAPRTSASSSTRGSCWYGRGESRSCRAFGLGGRGWFTAHRLRGDRGARHPTRCRASCPAWR